MSYKVDGDRNIHTGTQLSLDGGDSFLEQGSVNSFEMPAGDPHNVNSSVMSKKKNKRFNPEAITDTQKDLLKIVSQITTASSSKLNDPILK